MTITNCVVCGGIHYGSTTCPMQGTAGMNPYAAFTAAIGAATRTVEGRPAGILRDKLLMKLMEARQIGDDMFGGTSKVLESPMSSRML